MQNRAQKVMVSPSVSRRYDKFLDKIQHNITQGSRIIITPDRVRATSPKRNASTSASAQQKGQELLSVSLSDNASHYTLDSSLDLWKQLKRVTITVFQVVKRSIKLESCFYSICG